MFIKGPSCSLERKISFTRLVTFKTKIVLFSRFVAITGARSSSWAELLGGRTGSRGSRPGGWWGASWPASSGQAGRWPGSWTSRGSRRTRPSSCSARPPLVPSTRSRGRCAKWSTGPVSASTRRTRSGDESESGENIIIFANLNFLTCYI